MTQRFEKQLGNYGITVIVITVILAICVAFKIQYSGWGFLIWLAILVTGYSKKCNACGLWYGGKETDKELLSQHGSWEEAYDNNKSKMVPITVSTHKHYYKCKRCDNTWAEEKTTNKRN